MNRYKAAIFDMDGTVLNTLPDLANGIRHAFTACGSMYPFTDEDAGAFFGSGVTVAITRAVLREHGWPLEDLEIVGTDAFDPSAVPEGVLDPERMQRLEQTYRAYYGAHNADLTDAYAGIPELLQTLRAAGVLTAVVSNKPDRDCRALAEKYFPGGFDLCLGERPKTPRKPAPDMTLRILEELSAFTADGGPVDPADAVYIGDSEIDLQTAVNSGLDCIMVTWGFRSERFIRAKLAEKKPAVSTCVVNLPAEISSRIITA